MEHFEPIEQAILRQAIREVHAELGRKTSGALYDHLVSTHSSFKTAVESNKTWKPHFERYMRGQSVPKNRLVPLSSHVAHFLNKDRDSLKRIYQNRGDKRSLEILLGVLARESQNESITSASTLPTPVIGVKKSDTILDKLMDNLGDPVAYGRTVLARGVYQIYRRYKPTFAQRRQIAAYQQDENHAVICELAYVDPEKMECMLITAEFNVYWGTMYINHQSILSVIAQRPHEKADQGVYQRMYAIALQGLSLTGPQIYSGVSLKAGDTTGQPMAAECIFIRIPVRGNMTLYRKFAQMRREDVLQRKRVRRNSIFGDYILEPPPFSADPLAYRGAKRFKLVKDFPVILDMVQTGRHGVVLMRESLRSMTIRDLQDWYLRRPLEIFRHSGLATETSARQEEENSSPEEETSTEGAAGTAGDLRQGSTALSPSAPGATSRRQARPRQRRTDAL